MGHSLTAGTPPDLNNVVALSRSVIPLAQISEIRLYLAEYTKRFAFDRDLPADLWPFALEAKGFGGTSVESVSGVFSTSDPGRDLEFSIRVSANEFRGKDDRVSQTVETLAAFVNGTVRGDRLRMIDDAAAIETASASAITFVLDESHISRLNECQAAAVVVNAKIAPLINESTPYSLIVVTDTQDAFQKLLPLFRNVRGRPERGISPRAQISSTARVGENCFVAPGVCIGDDVEIGANCDLYPGVVIGDGCRIGENTILHANAVAYHDVVIGNNVIIHSGAVIGADGFGYRFTNGKFEKIPQLGTVHIHDDVEIGACTTVDRGAVGPTVVGAGTKLDNLVMVAHNCEVGRHNVFASQVGIAGSSITGDYVRLGGQVGIRDHVRLNTGCTVGAKAGVMKDIPAGETWLGIPATHESEQKRLLVTMKRIPDFRDDLRTLEKQIAAMSTEIEQLKELLSKTENSIPRRAAG
jgi:UDP-3-O-[3-hydroxymyristoyl] glucosamine N-acyltransferase